MVLQDQGTTLLRVDPSVTRNDLVASIEETTPPLQRYSALESIRVLAIGGIASASGEVELAGGSISRTTLDLEKGVVRKRAALSRMPEQDGLERHRREAHWLAQQRGTVFPRTRIELDGPVLIDYSVEFVPRYTLGEIILQGGLSASGVMKTLEDALDLLERNVYSRGSVRPQESYVSVVRRRLSYLRANEPEMAVQLDGLITAGAVVNGLDCRPLRVSLRQIERSSLLRQVARPDGGRGCHGDLIAEDILIDGALAYAPILVDPNPANCSRLVDVGKLLMGFEYHYDLLLRDLYRIGVEGFRGRSHVVVEFDGAARQYHQLNIDVAGRLTSSRCVEDLHSSGGSRISVSEVRTQAALHILAISPFHALHHVRRDRALAFLALGMAGLERVLRSTCPER